MLRLTAATTILLLALTVNASAYTGCKYYKFGSQDWWFCVSDEDGER